MISALGVDVRVAEKLYHLLMYCFGCYMVFSMVVIVVFMIDTFGEFAFFPIIGAISVGIFALAVVIH